MISVILPVYNGSLYLAEAIHSLLNQTYGDIEILVLDDGSTDTSIEVATSFSDSRIKCFTEKVNKGIVYQLNKGLSLARGEFIARMDADDVCKVQRFERQLNYMKQFPQIDVLGSFATAIGLDSSEIRYPTTPKAIDFALNYYCPILHPSVLMRASLFTERGFRYKYVQYAEDYQLWSDISNGSNISNISESLMYYRIHPKQTNKIKFKEQYAGAMIARYHKLKKTFPKCSEQFIDLINQLSNDYLFYGSTIYTNNTLRISNYDYLQFLVHYVMNSKHHTSSINFILKYLQSPSHIFKTAFLAAVITNRLILKINNLRLSTRQVITYKSR